MKTLAVIALLAGLAIAGSVYSDEVLTAAQSTSASNELPMLAGQSHAPMGIR